MRSADVRRGAPVTGCGRFGNCPPQPVTRRREGVGAGADSGQGGRFNRPKVASRGDSLER